MNTFFYTIDVCALNAFILHTIKNPEFYKGYHKTARMCGLENLAKELTDQAISARVKKMSEKSYSGCQSSIIKSIQWTGASLLNKVTKSPVQSSNSSPQSPKPEKKMTCGFCSNRSRHLCGECGTVICKNHCFDICIKCKDKIKKD